MNPLLDYFIKNPSVELSTHAMSMLGLKTWLKGRREWRYYNQASIERMARDLREEGKLVSEKKGGYVYFRLAHVEKKEKPRYEVKIINGERIMSIV